MNGSITCPTLITISFLTSRIQKYIYIPIYYKNQQTWNSHHPHLLKPTNLQIHYQTSLRNSPTNIRENPSTMSKRRYWRCCVCATLNEIPSNDHKECCGKCFHECCERCVDVYRSVRAGSSKWWLWWRRRRRRDVGVAEWVLRSGSGG